MSVKNVFVVGTGRCGTTTFAAACRYATNKTVSREGQAGGVYQLDKYPDSHIEVDAPLAFWMPRLRLLYPGCRFVHLVRYADRDGCLASMVTHDPDICRFFGQMVYHFADCEPMDGAAALYEIVNDMIGGPDVLRVRLREVKERWGQVWEWMECEGNFEQSREEWNVRHNSSS